MIFNFWLESEAPDALNALNKKLSKKATVLRDGKFNLRDIKELVFGDIIKIKDRSNRWRQQEVLIITFPKSYLYATKIINKKVKVC